MTWLISSIRINNALCLPCVVVGLGVVVVGVVGHGAVLQAWFCLALPTHVFPPWEGRGFVQLLSRKCVPPPHDFVQGE